MIRLHRYLGLALAGFLTVAGLTGSVIAFQHELDAWLNPRLFKIPPIHAMLPVQQLVASVEQADSRARVTTVHYPVEPDEPTVLWVEPRNDRPGGEPPPLDYNQVLMNPETGVVLGRRHYGAFRLDPMHIVPFLYKLHYSLHLPGQWGTWLMGGAAVAWFLDCFVGFYLTLPARMRRGAVQGDKTWWQRWKPAWLIKRPGGATRLNLDVHRASGLWLWPVLWMLAMSSIYLNLNTSVFTPVVALFSSVTKAPQEMLPVRAVSGGAPGIDWDQAVASARAALPASAQNWRVRWVFHISAQAAYVVDFAEPGLGRRGLRFEEILIDAEEGTQIGRRGYDNGTAGDRFIAWQYPLHSGQIAGLPGRILICLAGLAVAALSMTGVAIWVAKRRAQAISLGRRRAASAR